MWCAVVVALSRVNCSFVWGGRVGFGHVRGSSGYLPSFFFPHLCGVWYDGVGGVGVGELVHLGAGVCKLLLWVRLYGTDAVVSPGS